MSSKTGKSTTIKHPLIYYSEHTEEKILDFIEEDNFKEFRDFFNNKIHTVSDTGETYRIINSWSGAGLLLGEKDKDTSWRKFSVIDRCWIQIIKELRSFDFSREKIARLKKELFNTWFTKRADDTGVFGYFLCLVISKKDVVLIVTNEGEGMLALESEFQKSQVLFPIPSSYIVINLNKIFADSTNKKDLAIKNNILTELDKKETDLLYGIQTKENLKSVDIKTKDGKIERINYKKGENNPEGVLNKIRDEMKKGGRSELIIKIEDGEPVYLERIEKT